MHKLENAGYAGGGERCRGQRSSGGQVEAAAML